MDVKSKIITQFVRDLSFENPNGPGSFQPGSCLLYTSPSPRDAHESRMPSSA